MLERAIRLLRALAPAGYCYCSNVDCPSNVCQAARFLEEYDKSQAELRENAQ